jgi:thymidylate kinase
MRVPAGRKGDHKQEDSMAAGKIQRTICVSFSGIDGAGKSTQIEALRDAAEQAGLRVYQIRFWDDVAQLTSLREASGHKLFKGDKGIGSPERPINRRDKNVRSWPMACVRLFLYTLDALATRRSFRRALRSKADLVIFDRYVYDELANLDLANPFMRFYAKAIMLFVPRPDVAYILDADPVQARARKPEYPLEFIHINRQSYLKLSRVLSGMTVIPPMPLEEVKHEVLRHTLDKLPRSPEPFDLRPIGERIEKAAL